MKRGYSREFKVHGNSGKRYLLDDIPAGLWAKVRKQARQDRVSLRALILTLLTGWLERRVAADKALVSAVNAVIEGERAVVGQTAPELAALLEYPVCGECNEVQCECGRDERGC
jgi:hypothetical protein